MKTSSCRYQLEMDPVGVVQDLEILLNHINMVDDKEATGKPESINEKIRRKQTRNRQHGDGNAIKTTMQQVSIVYGPMTNRINKARLASFPL